MAAVVETPAIRRGKDVVFHTAVAGEEVELKEGWTREGTRIMPAVCAYNICIYIRIYICIYT